VDARLGCGLKRPSKDERRDKKARDTARTARQKSQQAQEDERTKRSDNENGKKKQRGWTEEKNSQERQRGQTSKQQHFFCILTFSMGCDIRFVFALCTLRFALLYFVFGSLGLLHEQRCTHGQDRTGQDRTTGTDSEGERTKLTRGWLAEQQQQ
jgi:Flp pilus assembly protein TadB